MKKDVYLYFQNYIIIIVKNTAGEVMMTSSIRDRIKEVSSRNSAILAPALNTDDKPVATALDVAAGAVLPVGKKAALKKKATGPKEIKKKKPVQKAPPSEADILGAAEQVVDDVSTDVEAFLEQPVSMEDIVAFHGLAPIEPLTGPLKPSLKNQKPFAAVTQKSSGKRALKYRMMGSMNPDYLADVRKSSTQKYIVYRAIIKVSEEHTIFTTSQVQQKVESWLTNAAVPDELKLRSVQPVTRVVLWYMNIAKKEHVVVNSSTSFIGADDAISNS